MRKNDIGLLRSLVRELVREGQVQSSDVISYQSPASSFRRIGMPGKAALKTIGVLYAVGVASDYVSSDCMKDVNSFGMPIPQATKAFAAYSAVDTVAGITDALNQQLKPLAADWAVAIKKDINGPSNPSGTQYEQLGGLIALFRFIETNINAGKPPNSVWPKDRPNQNQLSGHNATTYNPSGSDEFVGVVNFVKTLLNAQCDNAIDDVKTVSLVKEKFQKRADFIDFLKKYTDTMWKDYDARKSEHTEKLSADGFTLDQATTAAINSVGISYQAAINQVI